MPIIWVDEEHRIITVSHTPRDKGTFGGYDVEEVPEGEGDLRFNPDTKEFYVKPDEEE